jgi:polyadenylate-binding protein
MSTPTAPPAAPASFASASLYVGDLAPDVTEALLFEIFNALGPVASVRVCRDAATRRSLGYAYVNFHRVEDAERALDSMNFTNIRNRPCRIMWSHRDPSLRKSGFGNIFVKNLAKSIDNKALYDTFSIFGNILSCKVAMNAKRESLGYGFVHYEIDESAANAIQRVNGMVIAGQKVNVAPFKSKKERGGAEKTKYTNVYVKNLPEDMTKERLDELFSKYGVVTSSMIASGDDEKSRGFGFVNYGTAEEANAAAEGLNGFEIGGKRLFVGRAQKKEEREKELRERFEQLKAERQKKYAGVNLYIKNLSDSIDKDRLIAEFSKFGQISSARVMQDEAQKSRGFGFVCYATPEEATKAVTEMNGKMVDGKPLYVALAQRKEVRRAQLEAQHARAKMGAVPPGAALYPGPQGGPMYFPPQGVHPRMMFPPMNVPRRWNPSQGQPQPGGPQAGPQQRPGPQQMLGMPYVNMGPMARPPVGRGGRGGRGGQQQGGQGKPGSQGGRGGRGQGQNGAPNGVPNGQNPNPNFKYTQQVRNRDVQQNQPNQLNAPAAVQVPNTAQAGKGVLTIQELAAAPEEEQKQMIGERLFPLIQQQEPQLAGKITGMLLEMDNGELLHLLESQEALAEKINEALHVLKEVSQEGGAVEQDA